MFTKEQVNAVMRALGSSKDNVFSERSFQRGFIVEATKLYGDLFSFYPERSLDDENGRQMIDLVIIDNQTNETSFLEFGYATRNDEKSPCFWIDDDGIKITPINMNRHFETCFDCCSSIEILEKAMESGTADNAFLIFITNDRSFIKESNTKSFGDSFSISSGSHTNRHKEWDGWNGPMWDQTKIGLVGEDRNRPIETLSYSDEKAFKYETFKQYSPLEYGTFWQLVVEIGKASIDE